VRTADGLNGTAGLPDVDLMSLAGHAVHTRSVVSNVILHRAKEAGHLVRGKAHRPDVAFGQQPTDAVESRAHVGQKGGGVYRHLQVPSAWS
jgi:hypothetical protein